MNRGTTYELDDFFYSKTRTQIWAVFFENPEIEFYVRELEKKLSLQAAIVHRELKRMRSMGILKSRKFANLVLYKIDEKNDKVTHFRKMALKVYEIRELLRTAVDNEKLIRTAFLFGPVADGELTSKTNVDLFIILSREFGEDDYKRMKDKISEIETIVKTETSVDYWQRKHFLKKRDDHDEYILEVLDSKKIFLKGKEGDY